MGFNLDDDVLWVLAILAIVFFLFPQNKANCDPECPEKCENPCDEEGVKQEAGCSCIRRRIKRERRRLVY
jgi:hypothetical protein